MSLEYRDLWFTPATYDESDVVEVFNLNFPKKSDSIDQSPKFVITRNKVLNVHRRILESEPRKPVDPEAGKDAKSKGSFGPSGGIFGQPTPTPWFDIGNLDNDDDGKYHWTTDEEWFLID